MIELIKYSEDIDKYINRKTKEELGLSVAHMIELIKYSEDIDKYINRKTKEELGLSADHMVWLIKYSKNIDKYINRKTKEELGLSVAHMIELIKYSEDIDKYINRKTKEELGLSADHMVWLIKYSKNIDKYINRKTKEELGLSVAHMVELICEKDKALKRDDKFQSFLKEKIEEENVDLDRIINITKIIEDLSKSNSDYLDRIKYQIAMECSALPIEQQGEKVKEIKNLFEKKSLPEFAMNFLIFEQLHPNLLRNEEIYTDSSYADIPTFKEMTEAQRKHAIFSDLLRITVESNNRNLKKYLNIIEKGDNIFNKLRKGILNKDNLLEDEKSVLESYSKILNQLYNQTSRGKKNPRVKHDNLEKDLQELYNLFEKDKVKNISIPDRVVRMFGYYAGIRNFEQAKDLCEKIPIEAEKRNKERANKGQIDIKVGDFAKGIQRTEYIPEMFQNGVVSKDYLGVSADSDFTPCDMDVEVIQKREHPSNIYEDLSIARSYILSVETGRYFGSCIFIFENSEDFIKTRENFEENKENIKECIKNKSKIEYFQNNNSAFGIRTGLGSTRIKCIVADKYIEKLGLEIAMNGFYIPIVDKTGKVIFTPEMYDEIKQKMQGLSYYGLTEFNVDESAKNLGTSQIMNLVKESAEDASYKKKKIIKTLEAHLRKMGLEITDKRKIDLSPGTVEIIDTGSTGRGTNEPGDGDFDFMMRLDKEIIGEEKNLQKLKEVLREALSNSEKSDETGRGDFRYKGVSIEGIENEKVDIDITFTKKTDNIKYTTNEAIQDRLETIKKQNEEEYNCVIANILLAKKILKQGKVYKKKNAEAPQPGQEDTRGGLGGVGIENWILQNGGSFEKAARTFIKEAEECDNLTEFQKKYAIWDFGENYMADMENYPHDNFVNNLTEIGFERMKKVLKDYIKTIDEEKRKSTLDTNDR